MDVPLKLPRKHRLRAVERSENPGVPVLFGDHNLPPRVEIGLTDLPAIPAPPGTTGHFTIKVGSLNGWLLTRLGQGQLQISV